MIDVSALATDAGLEPVLITWHVYPAATVSDAFGEASLGTPADHTETIVVHATGRRTLARLTHCDQRRETISLYTHRTDIVAGGGTSAPTLVTYQGDTYEVAAVGDYSRMGGLGLIHAQLLDAVAS
jgi:hypothetical protein